MPHKLHLYAMAAGSWYSFQCRHSTVLSWKMRRWSRQALTGQCSGPLSQDDSPALKGSKSGCVEPLLQGQSSSDSIYMTVLLTMISQTVNSDVFRGTWVSSVKCWKLHISVISLASHFYSLFTPVNIKTALLLVISKRIPKTKLATDRRVEFSAWELLIN